MNQAVGGSILPFTEAREPKRRAADGLLLTCGAINDHVVKFGRPPTAVSYRQISTLHAMLNSSLESSVPSREPPLLGRGFGNQEGA